MAVYCVTTVSLQELDTEYAFHIMLLYLVLGDSVKGFWGCVLEEDEWNISLLTQLNKMASFQTGFVC